MLLFDDEKLKMTATWSHPCNLLTDYDVMTDTIENDVTENLKR